MIYPISKLSQETFDELLSFINKETFNALVRKCRTLDRRIMKQRLNKYVFDVKKDK